MYSIRKRKKHLYELRYMHCGKQISLYARTKQNAVKLYTTAHKKPTKAKLCPLTLFQWFSKWVDLYKKPVVNTATLQKTISIFNNYILKYIGTKPIKSITTEQVQQVINDMSKYPRQQTIAYNLLSSCLQQAFLTNYIDYNPCSAIKIKKDKGNIGTALTQEQLQKLHYYLDNNVCDIKNLILLYLNTGMRRSELLSITQNDLDYTKNEIHIQGTKTINSSRILQTTSQVMSLFPKSQKPFYDFTSSYVDHKFKDICDKLGFQKITIHSLRHTFATQCVERGVDMVVLQKWLGHASITMTIDRYSHIDTTFKQAQTKVLNKLI